MTAYFRDGPEQNIVRDTKLRLKLQIKLAMWPIHNEVVSRMVIIIKNEGMSSLIIIKNEGVSNLIIIKNEGVSSMVIINKGVIPN